MTIQEEKQVAITMWQEIACRIRKGRIRNIHDIVTFKENYLKKLPSLDYPSNCILCRYFNRCYTCPLCIKCGDCDCGESGNYFYELKHCDKEQQINYNYEEDRLEAFASYAEKIADVIKNDFDTALEATR